MFGGVLDEEVRARKRPIKIEVPITAIAIYKRMTFV